ncbi:MAG: hypothetical protein ACFFCE_14350 [Promethearchaeota archaeon]
MSIPKPRRLSKKKIRKSITLPEYLDDWIKRYLKYEKEQQKEKGNEINDNLKSYSSFISKILERVMNLFLNGKNLEDLEITADSKMKEFYEKITFRALIVYYEFIIKINKYEKFELNKMLNIFMMYKNFFTGGKVIAEDDAVLTLNRFKNFMISNNTTRDVMIERSGNKYIFQYFGIYPEMHYDFSKWIAGILGFLGIKVEKISYSNNYTRIDFKKTDLFGESAPVLKKRTQLLEYNTNYFTNFNKILEDEDDVHFWLRINQSNSPIISFKSVEEGLALIKEILDDLNKWITPREFKGKVLEIFKKLRWIKNIDENQLSFQLTIEESSTEYKIMNTLFNELKLKFELNKDFIHLK